MKLTGLILFATAIAATSAVAVAGADHVTASADMLEARRPPKPIPTTRHGHCPCAWGCTAKHRKRYCLDDPATMGIGKRNDLDVDWVVGYGELLPHGTSDDYSV